MDEIYELIYDRLSESERIFWIDIWREQPQSTEKEVPNSYPACFISIDDVEYEETHTRTKLANLILSVYVVQEHYQDTHKGSEDLPNSLGYFKVISEVENLLSNYQKGRLSPLVLARTQRISNQSNLITYVIKLKATYYQCK